MKITWRKKGSDEWELWAGGQYAGAVARKWHARQPRYEAYDAHGDYFASFGTLAEAKQQIKARRV